MVTVQKDNYQAVVAAPNIAYLSDRDYLMSKLPKEMLNGHLLVRDSGQVNDWLPAAAISVEKPCKAYVAIMVKYLDEQRISANQLDAFVADGWTLVKEPFAVATGERWEWRVLSIPIEKGPVALKLPPAIRRFRTQAVFVFK